ncbi:SH2 domain-containing protein 7-like [Acipenser ruthenus]|uniref:SH2 domain-containing protein 7-like n=1 Tax=Acipenser ruthenus TaxID=7906 RepID=UPI0027419597|nr:SH2 domain-containing protein 7-like [Acipenser ruthenus]
MHMYMLSLSCVSLHCDAFHLSMVTEIINVSPVYHTLCLYAPSENYRTLPLQPRVLKQLYSISLVFFAMRVHTSSSTQCCANTEAAWYRRSFLRSVSYNFPSCTMNHTLPKAHVFWTYVMFPQKDRARAKMARRKQLVPGMESPTETENQAAGMLKELALKWFTETQAPLILHNGSLPGWFHGFITRKDAEDQLKDKQLGCFLIRLSDRAIGYILSYKGKDRCRHFVITQDKNQHFIVSGDTETHESLTDLILYYKTSAIEPFGEYLSLPCSHNPENCLYDEINFSVRNESSVSVKAARGIWDQKTETFQRDKTESAKRPPLPPKNTNKRLTAHSSLEGLPSIEQVSDKAPPLQYRRSPPLKNLSRESSEEKEQAARNILYAHLDNKVIRERANNKHREDNTVHAEKGRRTPPAENSLYSLAKEPRQVCSQMSEPRFRSKTVYSELNLDSRSKSLPALEDLQITDRNNFRLCTPPSTPPKLSPKIPTKSSCFSVPEEGTFSHQHFKHNPSPYSTITGNISEDGFKKTSDNPLYDSHKGSNYEEIPVRQPLFPREAGFSHPYPEAPRRQMPTPPPDNTYEHVPNEPIPNWLFLDNTYEQIPERFAKSLPSADNTYETLPDSFSKHLDASSVQKNDKRRRFFADRKNK